MYLNTLGGGTSSALPRRFQNYEFALRRFVWDRGRDQGFILVGYSVLEYSKNLDEYKYFPKILVLTYSAIKGENTRTRLDTR